MRHDHLVSKADIKLALRQLREDSDDGWVLVDYVEKVFNQIASVREDKMSGDGWVKGWRDIGRRLGLSPSSLAVKHSLGRMPVEPTYFGRTPAYTEQQIEEMLKKGRRGNKPPEDS